MNFQELTDIDQLEKFLAGAQKVAFAVIATKNERYKWITDLLVRFRYYKLSKAQKGVVIQCIIKVTGYSRQQVTRLINQYTKTGRLRRGQRTVKGFQSKYTREDICLLAKTDERHDTPCGPALKKICERAWDIFGESNYERLAGISVSHLYNLRKSVTYTKQRRHFQKTKSKRSPIGERRKPTPNGKPGYIRIDTVHQGDLGKKKGLYHINAVDEVTQFEVVIAVEKISEHYLIPVLEQLLDSFPFSIISLHADNGSEYINQHVAKLLDKLLVELTKSRARHCNDNALAESKNGAVVRKFFGHGYISQQHASLINAFNQEHLNPYINYHRPCFFPEVKTDDKGKQHKVYRYENMMTPYDKLKSLPGADQYLKEGKSFEDIDKVAHAQSDNEAAGWMQKARGKLFKTIHEREQRTG